MTWAVPFAQNLVRFLEPMLVARCAAALGLLVVVLVGGGGCSQEPSYSGGCSCPAPGNTAVVHLGCLPIEPPVVQTIGPCCACPCTLANGSIPDGFTCGAVIDDPQGITLMANGAGTCHVDLTFANGAASSVDVDFVSEQIAACCGGGEGFLPVTADGSYYNPTVRDPTCDAGPDAGLEADAPSTAAVDAEVDADLVDAQNEPPDAFPASCVLENLDLTLVLEADAAPDTCAFTPADVACNADEDCRIFVKPNCSCVQGAYGVNTASTAYCSGDLPCLPPEPGTSGCVPDVTGLETQDCRLVPGLQQVAVACVNHQCMTYAVGP